MHVPSNVSSFSISAEWTTWKQCLARQVKWTLAQMRVISDQFWPLLPQSEGQRAQHLKSKTKNGKISRPQTKDRRSALVADKGSRLVVGKIKLGHLVLFSEEVKKPAAASLICRGPMTEQRRSSIQITRRLTRPMDCGLHQNFAHIFIDPKHIE